jgi:DNA-directed RNA polymerase specialized sigma24 family protein
MDSMDAERRDFPTYEEQQAFLALLYAELPRIEHLLSLRYGRRLGDVGVGIVLDETVRRALDFCHSFERGRSLAPWLRAIATHCAFDELRRRDVPLEPETLEDLAAAEREEPSTALEALERALGGLSSAERDVLLREEPAARLAARLGRTRGSTYNLRWAALKRLRRTFFRILGEERDA